MTSVFSRRKIVYADFFDAIFRVQKGLFKLGAEGKMRE